MALSKPVARALAHTREIKCCGYERDDGLWDIEATLTDRKAYSFANHDRGSINAGEAIHEMHVRLTIDNDFVVQGAEAATLNSPFNACPKVADSYKALIGLRVGPGWRKNVYSQFGHQKGCTHLTEMLLGPIGTTAYQTIGGSKLKSSLKEQSGAGNRLVNTCHALASDGEMIKREWPDLYTGD